MPILLPSGEVLAWLSVWSEVQTCMWPSWCHCHSLSLASVKSRLVLPFWYRPTRVVPEKGPLNMCVCVCVCVYGLCIIHYVNPQCPKICCANSHFCLTNFVLWHKLFDQYSKHINDSRHCHLMHLWWMINNVLNTKKYCLLVFTAVELIFIEYLPEYCYSKQATLCIFSKKPTTTTTMNNECNSHHNIFITYVTGFGYSSGWWYFIIYRKSQTRLRHGLSPLLLMHTLPVNFVTRCFTRVPHTSDWPCIMDLPLHEGRFRWRVANRCLARAARSAICSGWWGKFGCSNGGVIDRHWQSPLFVGWWSNLAGNYDAVARGRRSNWWNGIWWCLVSGDENRVPGILAYMPVIHMVKLQKLPTNDVENIAHFADRGTTMSDMLSYLFMKSV